MNGKNRQFGRKQERRSSTDLVKVTPGWPKGIQGRNISNSYITGIFDHNDPLGSKWPLAERQTPGNFIQTCNKQDLHWQCHCWKKYFNRLQNLACFVSPPFQTAVFFFHGMVEVGRHLWRSCGPAHCSEVGHPEQAGWPVIRFWVSPRILHNLCSNLLLRFDHSGKSISYISMEFLASQRTHCLVTEHTAAMSLAPSSSLLPSSICTHWYGPLTPSPLLHEQPQLSQSLPVWPERANPPLWTVLLPGWCAVIEGLNIHK